MHSSGAPSATPPDASGARERLDPVAVRVIAVLIASAFVVILNETTLNVALRDIMLELHIDESTVQWLTTAYLLTMAVIIPITGWLLERLSTRTLYLLAMGLFVLGTLVASVAPNFPVLLAARVVQASGTAVMMPLLMTTIMGLVPLKLRGMVMGNVTIVMAVAPAIGPALAGLILSIAHWRWIFFAVLPIAVIALIVGARLMVDVGERRHSKLDVGSIPLAALGFGGLVYALTLFGSEHDPDAAQAAGSTSHLLESVIVLVIAIAALSAFMWRQTMLQKRDAALLDLRTFQSAGFRTGVTILSISMLVLFGTAILIPLVLQGAYGMSPLNVGLILLPGGLVMGLLGPVVGRLYDRFGPRPPVVGGTLAVGLAYVVFSTIQTNTPWWLFLVAHIVLSAGLAFVFTPLFTSSLGSLPKHLYSHGSAMVGTLQQLAGAAGTAVFVAIMVAFGGSMAAVGADPAAMVLGARSAFFAGGALWLAAVIGAWLVQAPPADPDAVVLAGDEGAGDEGAGDEGAGDEPAEEIGFRGHS